MKTIRPQLQQAKDAYLAERYPGDLAADVMARQAMRIGPKPSVFTSRNVLRIAFPTAIAAAVVVAFFIFPRTPTSKDVAVDTTPALTEVHESVASTVVAPVVTSNSSDASETLPDLTSVLAVATDHDSGVSLVPSELDVPVMATKSSSSDANASTPDATSATASADSDDGLSFGFSVPSFPSAPSWDSADASPSQSSTHKEVL